jgi:hypothetical protein
VDDTDPGAEERWNLLSYRIRNALNQAQWTTTPMQTNQLDFESYYRQQFKRTPRVIQMPPSPGSQEMWFTAKPITLDEKPAMDVAVRHRLWPETKAVMKILPKDQLLHRGRLETTAWGYLRQNQLTKRINGVRESWDSLMDNQMPTKIAESIMAVKMDSVLKNSRLDMEHVAKYVKEHTTSSAVSGSKWAEADLSDLAFWKELYEWHREKWEKMADNGMFGLAPMFPLASGLRGRPDVLQDTQQLFDAETAQEGTIDQCRIVAFHPALSQDWMFIPDHKVVYREVLDHAIDVIQPPADKIISPIMDGGSIYRDCSEAFQGNLDYDLCCVLGDDRAMIFKDGTYEAVDGKNWESFVGPLLGEAFYPTKTAIGGHLSVPSGVWDTTLDDTLATIWMIGKNIPGVTERQPMDERTKFVLGLRYADDPLMPRLQGMKLSSDRSDKGHNFKFGEVGHLRGRHSTELRDMWLAAYLGHGPAGSTLLDTVTQVTSREYFEPSRVIADSLENEI